MSWGKEIKCEACQTFYLFFALRLIHFINWSTNIDSIFHTTSRLLGNLSSAVRFCHYVLSVVMDVITFSENLLHGVISLPDATSYDK